jgi:hypothetical protein
LGDAAAARDDRDCTGDVVRFGVPHDHLVNPV